MIPNGRLICRVQIPIKGKLGHKEKCELRDLKNLRLFDLVETPNITDDVSCKISVDNDIFSHTDKCKKCKKWIVKTNPKYIAPHDGFNECDDDGFDEYDDGFDEYDDGFNKYNEEFDEEKFNKFFDENALDEEESDEEIFDDEDFDDGRAFVEALKSSRGLSM
jgi:hypothetical protein